MSAEIHRVAEGIFATSQAAMQAQVADLIVFDVDGVLIDVHQSYPHVISRAVDTFLRERGFGGEPEIVAISPEETALFKVAGGFNSDWQLAQGAALTYLAKARACGTRDIERLRQCPPALESITRAVSQHGGGLAGLADVLRGLLDNGDWEAVTAEWDRDRITRLCQEFYAGNQAPHIFGLDGVAAGRERGLMLDEKPLIDLATLKGGPFRYGIYTGRNLRETMAALRMAGLQSVFAEEAMMTEDAGFRKPNPEGLFRLARRYRPRLMVYAGDNLDDWQTAARYESERSLDDPPCLFAGVLGGSPGPISYQLFRDLGVGLMAEGSQPLVRWLRERHADGEAGKFGAEA